MAVKTTDTGQERPNCLERAGSDDVRLEIVAAEFDAGFNAEFDAAPSTMCTGERGVSPVGWGLSLAGGLGLWALLLALLA
ncbi:MAG: hypothetical protein ACRC1J_05175 [Sandaracinobacteroides sp.]